MLSVLAAPPSWAQDDDHETPTTVAPPAGAVAIGDGIYLTGAEIVGPGTERELDAYQTAVFVQSWLATAFFGAADVAREPPPEAPVHRVDATGLWAGNEGTVTVYFATDGTTPYVAFPGMVVWQDPSARPEAANWFVAPDRALDAFNGEGELIPTIGIEQETSPSTAPEDEEAASAPDEVASSTEDSSALWPWLVAAGVAVAVAGIAVVVVRGARRGDGAMR